LEALAGHSKDVRDRDDDVLERVAKHPNTPAPALDAIVRMIASNQISGRHMVAVAGNPNTPVQTLRAIAKYCAKHEDLDTMRAVQDRLGPKRTWWW
ncbi:MAG: hypothetical protein K8H99_06040, partial [Nitrospirae bacterium]|nr:hypothetical protein [Fimbriimonadaceae bacterium]